MTGTDPTMPTTAPALGASEWTLTEARAMTGDLIGISRTEDERNGIQLLAALIDHLDRLGGAGPSGVEPNPLVTPAGRQRAAAVVDGIRRGPERLRLDQPVDAAVDLETGREVAGRLAASEGWQRNVGECLRALYAYLDEIYGGPGAFLVLLSPDECEHVAAATSEPAAER